MKYLGLLLVLFFCSCSIHRIQNRTTDRYVCEFEINGISAITYTNELLPRLNKRSEDLKLVHSNNISLQENGDTAFRYHFFIEERSLLNISAFVGYFQIFTHKEFAKGSNFNLYIYKEGINKVLIYQHAPESTLNSFDTPTFFLSKPPSYAIK